MKVVQAVMSAVVLAAGVTVLAAVVIVPRLLGGSALTVLTQSMEPGIVPGDMVVVAPERCGDIAVGDIVSYHPRPNDETLITHRVVSATEFSSGSCTFTVQGDNNDAPDPQPVTSEMLAGTVRYTVPRLGLLVEHRAWLAPAAATALLGYAAAQLLPRRRSST